MNDVTPIPPETATPVPDAAAPMPAGESAPASAPVSAATAKIGVLIVNLGTPDTADAPGVRRYLREFLSDPRVIENQGLLWQAILNGVILQIRPRIKARDYRKIWNTREERVRRSRPSPARRPRSSAPRSRPRARESRSIGRCATAILRSRCGSWIW